jgi:cell division protein FtsQ
VRRRVAALAPVARASVSRDWPHAVRIEVVERTAVAAVPGQTGFQLLDGSGVVFHSVTARPAGLPVVRLAAPGPDEPSTRAALAVLAALTPALRAQLVELVAEQPTRSGWRC